MVGVAATLCVLISYVPQIIKSYRTKSMKDFSILYLCLIASSVFLWIIYGLHIGDYVIIYANSAILALACFLLLLRMHYSGFS